MIPAFVRPQTRLGMLVPSSNTVLEPVLARMAESVPDVSVHFSRFRVTQIALAADALGQFAQEPMLAAADLLADAHPHVICWNGTSAGWLGFESDRALCAAISARTAVNATSSVLALDRLLKARGLRRIAFVTPYTDDVQARIVSTFAAEGYDCVAERHDGRRNNFSFAELPPERVADMVRDVARSKPEAVVVFCTNMWGGPLAAALEAETGIPLLDTVATAFWGSLADAGAAPGRVTGWGALFGWGDIAAPLRQTPDAWGGRFGEDNPEVPLQDP